jgi:hypothetical protein
MASVYQKRPNGFYFARYRGPGGGWRGCSTKSKNRAEAEQIAHGLAGLVTKVKNGRLDTLAAIQREAVRIFEEAGGEVADVSSIGDFLRQWVARISNTKSANTASRYGQVIELFLAHLGPQGEKRSLTSLIREPTKPA